jgi:DNA repair photolyase
MSSMNRTLIERTIYTWNVIVGCLTGCWYCYARRQAKRQKRRCSLCHLFEPHLHPERLDQPLRVKKPSLIFGDSMSDVFGPVDTSRMVRSHSRCCAAMSSPRFPVSHEVPKGGDSLRFPRELLDWDERGRSEVTVEN